jgi:YVTN family beta-propeller protein
VLALMLALAVSIVQFQRREISASAASRFFGPTNSQPMALTAGGEFLVAANPDNNTVSFFDLRLDRNRKIAEVPVQQEPWGVAFMPDGARAFVANTFSGTVSVMRVQAANGAIARPHRHIPVGTEPFALALTPNGRKLYVANARSNDVSVIDTATETVIRTITGVGVEPRGIAITNDGDGDDNDEKVYVTQFLSSLVPGKVDGADDAKAGHVTVISTATDTVVGDVQINPIADTGFLAAGDALARIPPGTNFTFPTGAYVNQLGSATIKGNFAYLPNTGASPNGPVRFDVNTQSLLSRLNMTTDVDAGTINMHLAVKNQTNPIKRFITQPTAIAFENASNEGYVVSAASNIVVKVIVDPTTGLPAVQNDPLDPTKVFQIPTGKNPRGILVNAGDTRAYVWNYVSREITVINLATPVEGVLTTMRSAALPAPGTLEDKIHVGKELYHTSIGEFDPATPGGPPIVGRMSNNGWGACSTCHPFGLSDNVVWIFPAGPRRSISQHQDFDLTDPARSTMRPLNWSANRDEQADFSLNIRAVSGGLGLIVLSDGLTPDPNVNDFLPLANKGRNQLKVRNVPAWDALEAFVQFGIRPPIAAVSKTDPDVIAGRALFIAANCQSCHGGPQWTTAKIRFTPPPAAAQIVAGQIIAELRQVGTFDQNAFNEVRQNAAPPLGAAGFVPPSVLSIFAFPGTLLHNGAAPSLLAVLDNVTHRSSGTAGVDTLTNPADRAKVARFMESIDPNTVPIAP